jgi:hypothetical protein
MESDTTASMETQPSTISFLDLDIPRPLQIIKRADDSRQIDPDTVRKLSQSSVQSSNTDESLGSAPEPPGGDRPLSIPKKRVTTRNIRATAAFQDMSSDSGYGADVSTPEHMDSDVDDTTPKPRRSTSDNSPVRAPEFFAPPVLTSKASMLCLRGRKFPGRPRYEALPFHEERVGRGITGGSTSPDPFAGCISTPPTSRISSSNFDISESATSNSLASPYLLAPRVVVTPECKALDDGVSAL